MRKIQTILAWPVALAACLAVFNPVHAGAAVEEGLAELFPDGLIDKDGNAVALDALDDKIVGVYFSAHWCGPCRKFTPGLVQYRNENQDKFEIVFVSSDRSEEAHKKYMEESGMEWPTLKWNSDAATSLKQKYEVRGIPTLVLLRDNGETITRDGRTLVAQNVEVDKIEKAQVVSEEYLCGKCDKKHTRQKLVFDE